MIFFYFKIRDLLFLYSKTFILLFLTQIFFFSEIFAKDIPAPLTPINEQRVAEIETMLNDKPAGFGDPCSKRDVWDQLLKSGKYDQFLKEMRNYSFPPFSKDDYFSLSDGSASSSGKGLNMMRKRARGLSKVTWAECLENKGNYTKMVEDGLRELLNQKSWVSPRIDFGFKNYKGIEYSVELTSSLYAHTIAQTLYLMGDKISKELRKEAVEALYKRAFNPVLNKIKTQNKEKENSFLTGTNNWNHVCLAGVVGAALTAIEDKHERAVFTYIGEYYSQNGLIGFQDDGYCTEGIVYYNYGFGHYVLLRENIWQSTNGKIDLFNDPKIQKIAMYPIKLEIFNGMYPSISDCRSGSKSDPSIIAYLSRNLGLGLEEYETLSFEGKTTNLQNNVMMVFPNSGSSSKAQKAKKSKDELLRSFFDQTGVLVCRPNPDSESKLGVAFKGGNNAESHNHNDVGSFTIVQGNEVMLGDQGSIPYTANIFNPQFRYTYKTLSSYGHPVPLVAGKEQIPGKNAKARIVSSNFTNEKDELKLDIASAYDVPELKKLERNLEYLRAGKGIVIVTDEFSFSTANKFETAIITQGDYKISGNSIVIKQGKQKMKITFNSPGNKLSMRTEEIDEGRKPYTRIGVYLVDPVAFGQLIQIYKPLN